MANQSSKCPANITLGQKFVLAKVKCYFYHYIHIHTHVSTYLHTHQPSSVTESCWSLAVVEVLGGKVNWLDIWEPLLAVVCNRVRAETTVVWGWVGGADTSDPWDKFVAVTSVDWLPSESETWPSPALTDDSGSNFSSISWMCFW